jgi:hypothetical protein
MFKLLQKGLPDGICRQIEKKSRKKYVKCENEIKIRIKFSQKMYVEYLKSVKELKIRMGATRRNSPRKPKK